MASELYEVEKIIDKRKTRKGRIEYLVRWRGFNSDGDTWEPEHHLTTCTEYIKEFDECQRLSFNKAQEVANKQIPRSPLQPQLQRTSLPNIITEKESLAYSQTRKSSFSFIGRSPMDLSQTGIKVLVPKLESRGSNLLTSLHGTVNATSDFIFKDELGNAAQAPGEERLRGEKIILTPNGGSPTERAKMGSRAMRPQGRITVQLMAKQICRLDKASALVGDSKDEHLGQDSQSQASILEPQVSLPLVFPAPGQPSPSLSNAVPQGIPPPYGSGAHVGSTAVGGAPTVGSGVGGSAGNGKRAVGDERQGLQLDKRQRCSVRQTETSCRYRNIVVRKLDGYTHIQLSTKNAGNSLSVEVMKEIQKAMGNAACDENRLLLLGAVGNVFCSGLDFLPFVNGLADNPEGGSSRMVDAIREFVNVFIHFQKPIVAAIGGPAVGLGAALLALCDLVWASDKAWFQTPYTATGQTPDGCSSFTFPRAMGTLAANEVLFCGRKLTALQACEMGLVSQVLWSSTFSQEVVVRVKELASCQLTVLEETKKLLRCGLTAELEAANQRECAALQRIWSSVEGMDSLLKYLQKRKMEDL
ncbi:chromodomain Y-like protein isoform X2 [Petromyzon marinus]|uniref:Chromodomain Y-like protein 2 isoform X2 n=1 Tax=Petromyzon marinus TaxID=7757 RepID=A0AAJ7TB66_PETMA|nr:chromodomain Y-like protein 2 isoform X2 [Petromyzon marinus]